ncbi:MAG TPA: hypothetical protein VF691_19915 [Cytophagaceae bacterium]|jgi:hypothetical protein
MKQLILFLIFIQIAFVSITNAQDKEVPPSEDIATLAKPERDWKFAFALDIRNSFVVSRVKDALIKRSGVTIWGANVGYEFKERHLYSAGIYTLTKKSVSNINEANKATSDVLTKWNLTFLSLGYTYTFFDKKKWEMKIPLEIGPGFGSIENDIAGTEHLIQKGFIVPFQLGYILDYQLTRWIGLYGSVGYRKLVIQGPFNNDFDSMYYTVGGIFYFTTIVEDLKKRSAARRLKKKGKK